MPGFRLCPPGPLEEFTAQVFGAVGADPDVAAEVAGHLVRANLAGHDSHGVQRVPQYVAQVDRAALDPAARPRIIQETTVTALVDARRGFGHFSTVFALEWAMVRASQHGMGAAAIRHSTHIGRLGEYAERAAARGLIALVTVGSAGASGALVRPHGGRERFLGTNPWSIGVPAANRSPMILDAATSMIAQGKIAVAYATGTPLPPGCIVDRDGQPSTAAADFYDGGALLPVGAPFSGHKGYGLGLASALLGGLAMGAAETAATDGSTAQADESARGQIGGVWLAVIDPGAFGVREHYHTLVRETLEAVKRTPPVPGVDEVMAPGEPEERTCHLRTREGVPVPEATWEELCAVAARFDLSPPEPRVASRQ